MKYFPKENGDVNSMCERLKIIKEFSIFTA